MAEKELGFKPRDHEETVVDTIEYVRKHHSHPKVNGSKPCSGPPRANAGAPSLMKSRPRTKAFG